jgi:serine/threonine protein kinase
MSPLSVSSPSSSAGSVDERPIAGERHAVSMTKRVEKLPKKFSDMYAVEEHIHDTGVECCIKRVRCLQRGTPYVVKMKLKRLIRDEALFCKMTERIMNSPDSTHVIKTFACYEDESYYYTILESLDGGDLFDFCTTILHPRKSPELAPDTVEEIVRRIMLGLLRSLCHLHAQGLIHRDVKLENLVFKEKERLSSKWMSRIGQIDSGNLSDRFADLLAMCTGATSSSLCVVSPKAVKSIGVKLIDFDFLEEYESTFSQSKEDRFASETLPPPKRVLGTDGYIAPEAYLGSACPKSDVFSAGVAMYILMSGGYPHDYRIFDDEPDENFVGSPKMAEIHEKLGKFKVSFGRVWDPFPEARNLCEQMLQFDVEKRLDALQALRHPWFLVDPMMSSTGIVPVAARGA